MTSTLKSYRLKTYDTQLEKNGSHRNLPTAAALTSPMMQGGLLGPRSAI